ncbi:MAG: rRNA maturation RNase YbeY [Candidatus Eisenbacteria bacterium]|nr:rRNA maturation RNase YbeY [Candidatus Eisenbacteria bacterium]
MEISVRNRQRKTGISTSRVRLLACRVLEREPVRSSRRRRSGTPRRDPARFDEISINFMGAKAVQSLNRRFTGRDEVTDVLAFEIAPDVPLSGRTSRGGRGARLADVVVCVDRAAEQARDYGVGLDEELARLTIHGLLHLCGLDDATPAQRREMRRREDFHLKRLGDLVGSVLRPVPGRDKKGKA